MAIGALSIAPLAHAEEPVSGKDRVSQGRHPPSSVRWKLVAGGLGLSAAAYGAGYLCASAWPEVPGSDDLKIPIAGPWISLVNNDCSPDDPDCGALLYVRGFLLIVDGLAQAGGLGIAGEGIFMTTESRSARAPSEEAPAVVLRPVPVVTAHSTGLGVAGIF